MPSSYRQLSLDVVSDGPDTTLVLSGELDMTAVDAVDRRARGLRAAGVRSLVVDLSGLTFMDSSGLRMLISLRNDAKRDGAALVLVRGPRNVHRVFELTGMQSLFDWR